MHIGLTDVIMYISLALFSIYLILDVNDHMRDPETVASVIEFRINLAVNIMDAESITFGKDVNRPISGNNAVIRR